ncbi:hypothetical protein SRHO_G00066850 [Serrasalmus rhombeus]
MTEHSAVSTEALNSRVFKASSTHIKWALIGRMCMGCLANTATDVEAQVGPNAAMDKALIPLLIISHKPLLVIGLIPKETCTPGIFIIPTMR